MSQQRVHSIIDAFSDREHAAVDLLDFQKEATDRPRLYRIMYVPSRQPEDVEMCRVWSQWICQHYLGEL